MRTIIIFPRAIAQIFILNDTQRKAHYYQAWYFISQSIIIQITVYKQLLSNSYKHITYFILVISRVLILLVGRY